MQVTGFFELDNRIEELGTLKGTLPLLAKIIPWENFRGELQTLRAEREASVGGRPAFDVVLMFKALAIGVLYNLSDDELEYQIKDRISFMEFLGLNIGDRIPDAKTLWLFRDKMTQRGLADKLFGAFLKHLEAKGYHAREGQIVDASIVEVPKQRNSRDENKAIKEGKGAPEEWSEHKKRQKDVDARWCKKRGKNYFGYKDHVVVDVENKLIRNSKITSAEVNDSKVFEEILVENKSSEVYADSAYNSKKHRKNLSKLEYEPRLIAKASRYHKLTEEEKAENHRISHVRCRIEHVFGNILSKAKVAAIRCIGIVRANTILTLRNLTYNFTRFAMLENMKAKKS